MSSCGKSQKSAGTATQKTFASPEAAGGALLAAAKSGDQNQLLAIFGPNSKAVLFTGDTGTDNAVLNNFVTAYDQMHRWTPIKAGGQVLLVGAENQPFPIPLGQNATGQWFFDTAAGRDEILARRIGKNELTAMDASRALAGAQQEYRLTNHAGDNVNQYAQKFVSDPGKQDGLYWPVSNGQTPSPLGQLGDFAKAQSSANAGGDAVFNGYRYRILSKGRTPSGEKDYVVDGKMTGGFAILACPTDYRNTGIMSFLIGEDGALYQKDLGESSTAPTEYNPTDGWTRVSTPTTTASRLAP
jgi:hypothetical protein